MSTARDMAIPRPAARLRFPAVLQHLQPRLDLRRDRDGEEHQPAAARRLSRRRRHQDRLYQGFRLQPRFLGAARQPAGDRGYAGRQVTAPRATPRWHRLMDLGFAGMPATARLVPLAPLRGLQRGARPRRRSATASASPRRPPAARRPTPAAANADGSAIGRGGESIAAAIAEVNAELARRAGGAQCPSPTPPSPRSAGRPRPGRPGPRRSRGRSAPPRPSRSRDGGAPARRSRMWSRWRVASKSAGTTGGNDWGVQLGAYRAKGDAERQLLTTALKDVPALARRAAPGRGRQGAGRHRVPGAVRRAEPNPTRSAPARRWRG